jgi:hypothetical protein
VSGLRQAKADEDVLGEAINKLEEIEPVVAEVCDQATNAKMRVFDSGLLDIVMHLPGSKMTL